MCKSLLDLDFAWKEEIISTSNERFEPTNIDQIILRLENWVTESIFSKCNETSFVFR